MPTMEEFVDRVRLSNVIFKLDLTKGFHQVQVKEADRENTAFISPVGKFYYLRMHFRMRNIPAIFQITIEKALRGCEHFARLCIDDIVIYSGTWQEHLEHIDKVLTAHQP